MRAGDRTRRGVTLTECLVAVVVLSCGAAGAMLTMASGHRQVGYAERRIGAVALGEHLLEEVRARPYTGGGSTRATWSVDGYDGFSEAAGALSDAGGWVYPAAYQGYARSVRVSGASVLVPEVGLTYDGLEVVIEVTDAGSGESWELSAFVVEPAS